MTQNVKFDKKKSNIFLFIDIKKCFMKTVAYSLTHQNPKPLPVDLES